MSDKEVIIQVSIPQKLLDSFWEKMEEFIVTESPAPETLEYEVAERVALAAFAQGFVDRAAL